MRLGIQTVAFDVIGLLSHARKACSRDIFIGDLAERTHQLSPNLWLTDSGLQALLNHLELRKSAPPMNMQEPTARGRLNSGADGSVHHEKVGSAGEIMRQPPDGTGCSPH